MASSLNSNAKGSEMPRKAKAKVVKTNGSKVKKKINYPKLEMPESPDVPGKKSDAARPSCEGEVQQFLDPSKSPVAPPPEGRLRILIGIPILRTTQEFLESFLKFWTELITNHDSRYEVLYQFAYRKPVHMAEEFLVQTALYNKCTHILFIDDDIYDVTKEDLDKLIAADKDIIAGVMHASKFPHAMCAFRRYDTSKKVLDMPVDDSMFRLYEIPCVCEKCGTAQTHWDGKHCPHCGAPQDNLVQPVDLIPFCFTLIKTRVFDVLKQPWFHCTNKYPSDSWFADRVLEAGLREYAHMGVRLNHAGVTDATKPFYVQMGMAKAKSVNGVVNLSPEQMEQHQQLLTSKMYETEQRLREKPEVVYDAHVVANKKDAKNLTLVTHGK